MNLTVACKNPTAGIESQSGGNTTLRLIPVALFWQFVRRFVQRAIGLLQGEQSLPDAQQLLDDGSLDRRTVTLQGWSDRTEDEDRYRWQGTIGELPALRGEAEDLLREDGAWTQELADIQNDRVEQLQLLRSRIEKLFGNVLREFGVRGVESVFQLLAGQFREVLKQIQDNTRPVTPNEETDVERHSRRMVRVIRESWVARAAGRLAPNLPVRWLLSEEFRTQIRQGPERMSRLYRRRRQLRLNREKIHLLEVLLGTDSTPGLLDEFLLRLRHHDQTFDALQDRMQRAAVPDDSSYPTDLRLVQSVDDVVDVASGRTFLDCAFEACQRAGCPAERLASDLQKNGLAIDGATLLPYQWSTLPARLLDEALLQRTSEYLGATDSRLRVDINHPVSALDQFAAMSHPLSPELLPLTKSRLQMVVERSAPYFACGRALGAEPLSVTFLYCHPADRPRWLALLALFGLAIADPDEAEVWRHGRFGVTLMQQTLGFCMGASKPFWKWLSAGNSARALNTVSPHLNREEWPEQRILESRIRNTDDCAKLLRAAEQIRVVIRVGSADRLAPVRRGPRIVSLFCDARCVVRSVAPDTVKTQIIRPDFIALLYDLHPDAGSSIDAVISRLQDEPDANRIADALTEHGFLREQAGLFQVAGTPSFEAAAALPELYALHVGELKGLTRTEFENRLLDNDVLYTQLFCSVLDGWERGRLSRTDVPESVIQKSNELKE